MGTEVFKKNPVPITKVKRYNLLLELSSEVTILEN